MAIAQFSSHARHGGLPFEHVETKIIANVAPSAAGGDVITQDALVHVIVIANESGAVGPVVNVRDRQDAPLSFGFGANIVVSPGSSVVFESAEGVPATGGLNVVCDTLNACSVKVVWRKP